jgi:hypothetical protein
VGELAEQSVNIFVSHSDSQSALELDRLIDTGFSGRLMTFNTSRSDHGLNPGDEISPAVLGQVRASSIFLSLWSPSSIARPAWMAWELGAAAASEKKVLMARVRGVRPGDLPLNLSSRFCPDLGNAEEFLAFFRTISRIMEVPFSESTVRTELDKGRARGPSVFDATDAPEPRLELSLHGSRALVENLSDVELHDLEFEAGDSPASELLEHVSEQLALLGRKLAAKKRVVIPLAQRVTLDRAVNLHVKYTSEKWGRERQWIMLPASQDTNDTSG